LQKTPQPHIHPGCRPDAASLDAAGIAALRLQIRVHDEEPVHALPLRAEQLHTVPLGKGSQGRVRGAADQIDLAICERRVGLVDREDQFERDVKALALEEAELDRRHRRKIRVRDEIRDRELHITRPLASWRQNGAGWRSWMSESRSNGTKTDQRIGVASEG